ncbi:MULTISPECIES: urea ABC transporter ATP-binding subunit UrtE [Pseudanabaena]|uniref:Urea ABC transporter, ATP-binding protein UrtE n=2 Tax=Pseudanabaena TaxID=1152 RepID=L8N4L4_9CYAN|nr:MULTISPECIES: urea ABC transporter ATP-binding subunit UrtE [Pseudanabaena]ELS34064.1 urea ABC transporter, ATP-binding protein UrtE [Pseudanabaena biceps PCC 7429]MDG3493726.1 urea ABC transporter ATP-binding subunit UrtE [Pseudanabaena catenata USMAC16]
MLLELTDVTVSYGQTPVLFGVNMAIEQGDIACLLGRNGVGKTTLLRSVIGLNKVMSGNIVFDADNITKVPTFKRARYGISYIPQGREIIPYLSVLDNLKLGMSAGQKKYRKIPDEIFEFFPMLKQHLTRQGGLLSGGQQQQLAIARGLMSNPKIMLLDEPTEGIQPSIVQEIEETLKRINREKGITLIVVEQKVDFARQLAQKFFIMEKGAVVANGATADLSDDLVHQYLAI